MPSHQERVRQNYCDHLIVAITSDLGKFMQCIKCGRKKHIDIITKISDLDKLDEQYKS